MPTQTEPNKNAVPKAQSQSVSDLKDCLDALEKAKAIRRELKSKLNRDMLSDAEEIEFASALLSVSEQIRTLEGRKLVPLAEAAAR